MDKDEVAEILAEIGTLLELKGENPFKTRAYQNAARTIESLSEPLAKMVAEKRLGQIKGIGEALEQKITELVETGRLAYYDELKASIPPGSFNGTVSVSRSSLSGSYSTTQRLPSIVTGNRPHSGSAATLPGL